MKTLINKYYKIAGLLLIMLSLGCCTHEEPLGESQLDYSQPKLSELDKWIKSNYFDPYNIDVQYKWNQNTVDNNRFLYPPSQNKIKPALEVIKKIWIEPYIEIGGKDFLKKIAPREIVLVGGENLNLSGTKTLGYADGGRRITLFETDLLNKKDASSIFEFMHTIQHEYVHILNQNKPFDEKAWNEITPEGYSATWNLFSLADSVNEGFISSYARANIKEDFAETSSILLLLDKNIYEDLIKKLVAANSQGAVKLKLKESIVVNYYKNSFNIDFYALRDLIQSNLKNL